MPQLIDPFVRRMQEAGANATAIAMFCYYFEKLAAGKSSFIRTGEIASLTADDLVPYNSLPEADAANLSRVVMIKLNGGLGTSMGLSQAKSLLPLKESLTFLDVIVQQSLLAGFPLVLMNSFSTHEDTMAFLRQHYPATLRGVIEPAFVQNQFPRIRVIDAARNEYGPLVSTNDNNNWNPPGHGDLYPALYASGLLDRLLDAGHDIAFVSNSDNLGAFVDERILTYMCDHGTDLPFLMEVRERTAMDRKGGHLAKRLSDGQLILRELAQCPLAEQDEFQNIARFGYFNTNNLWINLRALRNELERNGRGFLELPLIQNPKQVEGCNVIQIETAMGAAIELFKGAKALIVPRSRYAPVKTTNQLLVVRSDAYSLDPRNRRLLLVDSLQEPPVVTLADHYRKVDKLDAAFPSVPSLRECDSLTVDVPAAFAPGAIFRGHVRVTHSGDYPAGTYEGTI